MPAYKESKDDLLKHGYAASRARSAGLEPMVESDAYCIDVSTQGTPPTRALQSVALGLLDDHLRHWVADAVSSGDREEADRLAGEARAAVERLVKS